MPTFAYTAVEQNGRENSGSLEAQNRPAAIEQIIEQGLYPVSVEESRKTSESTVKLISRRRRVSPAQVEAFTRELANLLSAGVPLSRALHLISREAAQATARKQWAAIHDDVVGGTSLANALAKWPRTFPPVYVAMVQAGETGGFLDAVLGQIADFRSREQELKGKVKASLVYPIVLAVLAGLVLIFLLTYFIPRFSGIFAEFGGALPWLTRAIVSASRFVMDYGVIAVILVALAAMALQRAMTAEASRRVLERATLAMPVLGGVLARFALVRFCRMLGTMLGAGVPLTAALRVAKAAVGNQILADAVTRAIDQVQRGIPLARSLAGSPELFPASVVEMVAVAEESGRLDKELVRLAMASEAELDRRLRMLVALAEPALLFVMAAVIGTVVIGMLLPIFTLQNLIR